MKRTLMSESQTFTYRDGTSSTWTKDGDRYWKDDVEMGDDSLDGWGYYFKDYQRHIHKWEQLPDQQQMRHVMHAWGPPLRESPA